MMFYETLKVAELVDVHIPPEEFIYNPVAEVPQPATKTEILRELDNISRDESSYINKTHGYKTRRALYN